MEAPENPSYNKEIVDLLLKIKRHLKTQGGTEVKVSDPRLLEKLAVVEMDGDTLLKSMVNYLMALAGDDWTRYLDFCQHQGSPGKKSSSSHLLRGAAREKNQDNVSTTNEKPKTVRYYRGQPIVD